MNQRNRCFALIGDLPKGRKNGLSLLDVVFVSANHKIDEGIHNYENRFDLVDNVGNVENVDPFSQVETLQCGKDDRWIVGFPVPSQGFAEAVEHPSVAALFVNNENRSLDDTSPEPVFTGGDTHRQVEERIGFP